MALIACVELVYCSVLLSAAISLISPKVVINSNSKRNSYTISLANALAINRSLYFANALFVRVLMVSAAGKDRSTAT